jgi:hypothetical protein
MMSLLSKIIHYPLLECTSEALCIKTYLIYVIRSMKETAFHHRMSVSVNMSRAGAEGDPRTATIL